MSTEEEDFTDEVFSDEAPSEESVTSEPEAEEAKAEAPKEETEETPDPAPQEGDDTQKEAAEEPEKSEAAEERPQFAPKDKQPLTADEVDAIVKLRQENAELKRANQAAQFQQPQPQSPPPDVLSDPEAWQQYQAQQAAQIEYNSRVVQSRFHADREYGKETVQEAVDSFMGAIQTDPVAASFAQSLVGHPSPAHAIMDWHQNKQTQAKIAEAGGLEAYVAQQVQAAQAGQQQQTPATPPAQAAPTTQPPPSLAKAGSGTTKTSSQNAAADQDMWGEVFD